MRLQILGGGSNQLNGIIRAVKKNHEVVLVDYYENPPGKKYADHFERISTFDVEGNIKTAQKYQIDGVMTLGTDQPVYTVARVADALKLPAFLDVKTAKAVTNKELMKKILKENQIPTVPFSYLSGSETLGMIENKLKDFSFPVVIKPLDSQGQRGVFKLNSVQEVFENIDESLSFSREEKVLAEEYYKSDEITVSAWVENKVANILTVTDRETFESKQTIGICYAHEYPSRHQNRLEEITRLIEKITAAFEIPAGPLYVQLLVGEKGIVVNEVACRIGGAYEDIFIPYLTGFDILNQVIDESLGIKKTVVINKGKKASKFLSVQLFFAKPGTVECLTSPEKLKELPGVIDAGYNIKEGQRLNPIDNATARAGYLIIAENSRADLNESLKRVFKEMKILDQGGKNLLITPADYARQESKNI